jgi:hypothetical protein
MHPITQQEREDLKTLFEGIQKAFTKDYINENEGRRQYDPLKVKEYSKVLTINNYVLLFSYVKNVTSLCVAEFFTLEEVCKLIDKDGSQIKGLYDIVKNKVKINTIDAEFNLPSKFLLFQKDIDLSKKQLSDFVSNQVKFLKKRVNLIDVAFLPMRGVNTYDLIKPEIERLFDESQFYGSKSNEVKSKVVNTLIRGLSSYSLMDISIAIKRFEDKHTKDNKEVVFPEASTLKSFCDVVQSESSYLIKNLFYILDSQ